MFIIKSRISVLLALLCFFSLPLLAQQKPEAEAPKPVAIVSGLKGKIFEIKYREPREIYGTVMVLGSGAPGATMSYNQETRTLTVRDYPENLATIEEAIKRLDVPRPNRPVEPDIELHIHVLLASQEAMGTAPYPKELEAVVKQLQTTLNYQHYSLLTSIVQRTKGTSQVGGDGNVAIKAGDLPGYLTYKYWINRIVPEMGENNSMSLLFREFAFELNGQQKMAELIGSGRISTTLSLRDGEKVVVGTAALRDKGMIVVLTAKVMK